MNSAVTSELEIVTFSTLYPNSAQPNHGVFVENRLRHLISAGRVNARVVAPVPWFPSSASIFGRYALHAKVMPREMRFGIPIQHPKYFILPKVGMTLVPKWLAGASLPILRQLQRERDFALIDAHLIATAGRRGYKQLNTQRADSRGCHQLHAAVLDRHQRLRRDRR